MKYEIDGLEKGRIISCFINKNKFLEVRYLDGSKDILESTNNNMENVRKQMYIQANEYVNDFSTKKEELTTKLTDIKISMLSSSLFLLVISLMALLTQGLLAIVSTVALVGLFFVNGLLVKEFYVLNKHLHDLEKYNLFIQDFEEKTFHDIVAKETKLQGVKKKQVESININTLDKYSLKQMKDILLKIERYQLLTTNSTIDVQVDNQKNKTYTKLK